MFENPLCRTGFATPSVMFENPSGEEVRQMCFRYLENVPDETINLIRLR